MTIFLHLRLPFMRFAKYSIATIASIITSSAAYADDEPRNSIIVIDDFRPKAKRFALSFGVDYGYYAKNTIGLRIIGSPATDGASSVIFPLSVNQSKQQHVGTFTAGISTSLSDRFTINSKVRALIGRDALSEFGIRKNAQTYYRFGDLSIGASYQLSSPSSSPFYSVFGTYNVLENSGGNVRLGKSYSVGASASILSDPLLYTLAVAYADIGTGELSKFHNLGGKYLIVSPNVTFSINQRTSLNGGFSTAISLNGSQPHSDSPDISTVMYSGISYRISEDKALSLSARYGVAGNNSFGISSNIIHKF